MPVTPNENFNNQNNSGARSGFEDLYWLVKNANTGGFANAMSQVGYQGNQPKVDPKAGLFKQGQDAQSFHEASSLENFLINLNQTAENTLGRVGLGQELDITDPKSYAAFLPTVPAGPVAGLMEAPSKLYEGVTGNNLTDNYVDPTTGQTMVADYQLDPVQRLAQTANAGIDVFGLGIGAEAEAAKGFAGLFKAARGAEQSLAKGAASAAGNAAKAGEKSLIDRFTLTGSKITNSVPGTIAFDAATEGFEEGAQSYLDDARMQTIDEGSFGRALNNAYWGALGGGLMAGGGVAMQKAAKIMTEESQSATERQEKLNQESKMVPSSAFDHVGRGAGKYVTDPSFTRVAKEAALERLTGENRRRSGVVNATSVSNGVDTMYGIDQHGVGFQSFMNSYLNSRFEDNKEKFASKLQMQVDEVDAIINDYREGKITEQQACDILNTKLASIKQSNSKVWVALKRDPATGLELTKSELVEFFVGTGISENPLSYSSRNSDLDGDKLAEMWGLDTDQLLRVSDAIVNGQNKSNLGFSEWGNISGKTNISHIRDSIDATFNGYESINVTYQGQSTSLKNAVISMYEQATKDGVIDSDEYGRMMNFIVISINEHNSNNNINAAEAGQDVVQNFIYDLQNKPINQLHRRFEAVEKIYVDINGEIAEIVGQGEAASNIQDTAHKKYGKTGKYKTIADLMQKLGYSISRLQAEANVIWRQMSDMKFWVKEEREAFYTSIDRVANVFEEISPENVDDIFTEFFVADMRLTEQGGTPGLSIESSFNAYLHILVMKDLRNIGTIDSNEKFQQLMESVKTNYNRLAGLYNSAMSEFTTRGVKFPIEMNTKKEITEDTKAIVPYIFDEIFGDMDLSKIIKIDPNSQYTNRSIRQIIENTSIAGLDETFLSSLPSDVRDMLVSLERIHLTEKQGVQKRIEQMFSIIPQSFFDGMRSRLTGGRNKILSGQDFAFSEYFLNAIDTILDTKLMLTEAPDYLNWKKVLTTKYGNDLYSGDVDLQMGAIAKIGYSVTYARTVKLLQAYENAKTDKQKERIWDAIVKEVNKKIRLGGMHSIICSEILSKKKSFLLTDEGLMGAGKSLSSLQSYVDRTFTTNSELNVLVDALTTEDSKLALNALRQKVRIANTSMQTAHDRSREHQLKQWQAVEDARTHGQLSYSQIEYAFKMLVTDMSVELDKDIYMAMLSDTDSVSTTNVETESVSDNIAM